MRKETLEVWDEIFDIIRDACMNLEHNNWGEFRTGAYRCSLWLTVCIKQYVKDNT